MADEDDLDEQPVGGLVADLLQREASLVPSVPLSQKDVIVALEKLNETSHALKGNVYEDINTSYEEFIQTFDYGARLEEDVKDLATQISNLSQKIEDPETGIQAKVVAPAVKHQMLSKEIDQNEYILGVLSLLQKIQEQQETYSEAIKAASYSKAASSVKHFGALVKELPFKLKEEENPKIFNSLKKRYHFLHDRLRKRVEDIFPRFVSAEKHSFTVFPSIEVPTAKGGRQQQEEGTAAIATLKDVLEAIKYLDEGGEKGVLQTQIQNLMGQFKASILSNIFLEETEALRTMAKDDLAIDDTNEAAQLSLKLRPQASQENHAAKRKGADPLLDFEQHVDIPHLVLLFEHLTMILEFIRTKLLCEDPVLIRAFGDLLWNDLCQKIIMYGLSAAIPPHTNELKDFQKDMLGHVSDFEAKVADLGFYSNSKEKNESNEEEGKKEEQGEEYLTAFLKDIDNHFALKKQRRIFKKTRRLLMGKEHTTVEVSSREMRERRFMEKAKEAKAKKQEKEKEAERNQKETGKAKEKEKGNEEEGEDEAEWEALLSNLRSVDNITIFKFPKCQISAAAAQLVDMLYATLEEACNLAPTSPQCAKILYETARDCCDMYRAIMPVYHASAFQNVPALTMVFHNSCMYIAFHLMTIGHQYSILSKAIGENITFLDMVHLFRRLGETHYCSQMQKQLDLLKENLLRPGGFHDTHEAERYSEVETAIKQSLHHLTHLSKIWKGVLPNEIYLQALGTLTDSLLVEMIHGLEELSDISEEETHRLSTLFSMMFKCEAFFHSAPKSKKQHDAASKRGEEANEGEEREPKHWWVRQYVPHWTKFSKAIHILDEKLINIVADYQRGQLREFKPQEIRGLITALFSNSQLRKEQLALVK